MGNTPSSSSSANGTKSRRRIKETNSGGDDVASRAKQAFGDLHFNFSQSLKRLEEEDHPAAALLDSMCGPLVDGGAHRKYNRGGSFYSEDYSEDDSRTISEDETTTTDYHTRRRRGRRDDDETESYLSQSDLEERGRTKERLDRGKSSQEEEEEVAVKKDASGVVTQVEELPTSMAKPLASSFARRCYFTKQGIGKTTQHYEGLTLTGNVVLMLAAAMKLKGCPTICDEDLRRVEQTYPNQFSRLPDELLLSSGWRRISKYCHFSNKPIPDGVPFFHSKERLHSSGGYYFLLAAAVGMVRPIDVERLSRDTLVLLETDYPQACDTAPDVLIKDPEQWTLVDKFCFFSGGPINTDEDVYYQADFDGNPIYMLAFLSPSLTPAELYKLNDQEGLTSVAAVEEVESVYDLTDRDFDDLRLYHLGPCRALPQYILQPQAWTKVLPPHFLAAREAAQIRAQEYEIRHGLRSHVPPAPSAQYGTQQGPYSSSQYPADEDGYYQEPAYQTYETFHSNAQVFDESVPMDEAIANQSRRQQLDPPDDEPPSLRKRGSGKSGEEHVRHTYSNSNRSFSNHSYQKDEKSYDEYDRVSHTYSNQEDTSYYEQTSSFRHQEKDEVESYQEEEPSYQQEEPSYHQDEESYQHEAESFQHDAESYQHDEQHSYYGSGNPYYESGEPYYEPRTSTQYYVEDEEGGDSFEQDETGSDLNNDPPMLELQSSSPSNRSLPPRSPESEFSQTSAMRGAQEMLRRNRQRRMELSIQQSNEEVDDPTLLAPSKTESESGVTWESGSEITSIISGSSAWTDNTNNPDRSSRRALILQMAKARMKNNKLSSPQKRPQLQGRIDEESDLRDEEKKLDLHSDNATDIDFSGDLD